MNYLLKEAKVLVNSGTGYGEQGGGYIRIITSCFYEDSHAIGALENIKNALTDLAKKKGVQ